MRVYHDRSGRVTGYSTSGWVLALSWFLRGAFFGAVLCWPLAFSGWQRWLYEGLWLAAVAAGFIIHHVRTTPGQDKPQASEPATIVRPGVVIRHSRPWTS